jgi:hypothetical protein
MVGGGQATTRFDFFVSGDAEKTKQKRGSWTKSRMTVQK